jgi:hypothetical protein
MRLEGICGSSARPFATWEGPRRALRGSSVKFSRRRPPRPPWPSSSASTDLDVVMQARAEARESGRPLKKGRLAHTLWHPNLNISGPDFTRTQQCRVNWMRPGALCANLWRFCWLDFGFWADGEESLSPLGGRQMVKALCLSKVDQSLSFNPL